MRKNASPIFCALSPQEEIVDVDDGSQITPPGFYLIPLPFSDYLRDPPQHQSVQGKLNLFYLEEAICSNEN